MKESRGFTLVELLVIVAMMGIISSIGFPFVLKARDTAAEAATRAFTHNLYKTAYAHIAVAVDNTVVTDDDCTDGYTAGDYSIVAKLALASCEVRMGADDLPFVRVVSAQGMAFTLP